ncbi:hypothetical protein [Solidesulfovibrio sp. C21]|uniref:hypothetical protein n=1 Tax=Solidesulfovibrio sp. C21 TaxID=3398613 RepID=UPI0039FDD727
MTRVAIHNATKDSPDIYVIFGVAGPVCPNPVDVPDFPALLAIGNHVGTIGISPGQALELDPKGRCFSAIVGFYIMPQCPVPGANFPNGQYGTNIGEFTLNVTGGQEAFDISCVNGVNCWMEMTVTGSGWGYGPQNTPISSISNKALGCNSGNPGVYPVNCTDCIQLIGNPPCPSLQIGPAQKERICNIQRDVQSGSNDVLTITLKEGEPPAN